MKRLNDEYFLAGVHVARPGMLYFVLQMADGVEVLRPLDFRREVTDMLRKILSAYSTAGHPPEDAR